MYIVGLTGSIASGKSTVANYFREKNIIVHSADEIARGLTQKGEPAWEKIKAHFGEKILTPSGDIDRALLKEVIFVSPPERMWLENLLHPLIREIFQKKLLIGSKSESSFSSDTILSPYQMLEIPLLRHREENYPYLNRVLLVVSDREAQIRRVRSRDNLSREQALNILKTQPNYLEEKNLVDDLLVNDGTKEQLFDEVEILHEKYLALAKLGNLK